MVAFVIVLTAGMTVGIGPETVSGDEEGFLAPTWTWEGTDQDVTGEIARVYLHGGILHRKYDSGYQEFSFVKATDEGGGRVRFHMDGIDHFGICKRTRDGLIICIGPSVSPRPTSFRGGGGQYLLTIHRLKSDK